MFPLWRSDLICKLYVPAFVFVGVAAAQEIEIPQELLDEADAAKPAAADESFDTSLDISIPAELLEAAESSDDEDPEEEMEPEVEEESSDLIVEDKSGKFKPSIDFEVDYFGYYHQAPGAGDDHLGRGDLKLEFDGYFGKDNSFLYNLTPRLRWASGDNSVAAFDFRERDARRPLATLHEAYAGWVSEKWEVSLGKKVYNWGVADAYNPLDDLNPRDYLDVPTSDRIGVPSLSVFRFGEKFDTEVVWTPFFTPSRVPLPGMDNRWLGSLDVAQFDFTGRSLPDDQLENGQGGVRLTSSSLIDGWDFALTWFRGRQSAGVFRGDSVENRIVTSLEYPRYQEIGASFSTVLGDWQVHGEGAWHKTDQKFMDDDYLEYVVGVNRTFSEAPIPFVDEWILTLEYAGQEVTRPLADGSSFFGSRSFARPFQDAIATTLTLAIADETDVEIGGAYDFADSGSIIQVSLIHEISNNLEFRMGTDIFSGPQNSFFGKWGDNDRFFLTLSFTY